MAAYDSLVPVTTERIRFYVENMALSSFIQAVHTVGEAATDYFDFELDPGMIWQDADGYIRHGPPVVHSYDINFLSQQTRGLQGYELYLRIHELLSLPSPDDGIRLGVADFHDSVDGLMELEKQATTLDDFLQLAANQYVHDKVIGRLDDPGKQLFKQYETRISALQNAFGHAYGFESYRQMHLQMTLSRAVENFQVYLSELMRLVLRTHSRSLNSTEFRLSLEDIRRFKTIDDMITQLIDKRVNDLSYKGIPDLQQYIKKDFKFDLFRTKEHLELAEVYVQLRNIMVHNRGIVNEIFLSRMPANIEGQYEAYLGKPVPLIQPQVVEVAKFFARCVSDVDQRAIEKWKLPHHPPGMIHWDTDSSARY